MKAVNLIFPHQLVRSHELLENGDSVYLIEERLFFRQLKFHRMKLAFHRASMKHYQDYLLVKGVKVVYVEAIDPHSDVRKLLQYLAEQGIEKIQYLDPTDDWLKQRIRSRVEELGLECQEFESPLFLNSRMDLSAFFKPEKKSFFQTTFYKQQRKLRQILIDEHGDPVGGKWSFDSDNRKKYPSDRSPPDIHRPEADQYWQEAVEYVSSYFKDNPGDLADKSVYPLTHDASNQWLLQFIHTRLHDFGPYEDAIVRDESILHHSLLSPLINVGLIQPEDILRAVLDYAQAHEVPINSLEGFVRQLIGWREFIRGMYEVKGRESRTCNYWNFKRSMPKAFYSASTGIDPVDDTIRKLMKIGYCHHIERLMVLGNFMLLCEIDPDEVYRWFMELFIDAYDWVMVPNVYGMSQFADGGLFATKPYISGSNYLMKMSDYRRGEWQTSWDGLFWRFMHVHRDFFLGNPRLAMLVRTFDKMDPAKRSAHLQNADQFLQRLDQV